jgi:hypothetical protein
MEKIIVDLQPEPAKPIGRIIQRTLFGLVGVINIIQAVMSSNSFRFINLVFGIIMLVFAVGYRWFYKPKLLSIDESNIELSNNNVLSKWENIAKVEIRLFNLILHEKTGKQSKIYLGNLTFQQLREIKLKTTDLAKSKGIKVQVFA